MSARQAFVPRTPSSAPSSEPHPHSTDAHEKDPSRDMFFNGNGKARSVAAFLGQKRGTGADTGARGSGPTPGPGLGRANSSTNRRSFDGILRPEMEPLSIIPYPTTTQLGAGVKQAGTGQTPRKTVAPGAFEFPRPMTPVSAPRALKKGFGIFAEGREEEASSNGNAHGSGIVFMEPGDEADVRIGAGTGVRGYMRVFERPGGGGSADEGPASLEHDVVAPVPGYAPDGLGANLADEECEVDGICVRSSRSLDAMTETEVRMERNHDSQRNLGGTKRRMRREDMEDHQQGSAKRMKRVQHDPNGYSPISTPHTPPTPGLQYSSVDVLDPSLIASSLFENIEEFVNLEEIDADWKRWRECTTEEWLKGADELARDYMDILNMVKDHLTEKVLAYANMISSVEERRTEVDRNIEIIQGKGNVVRENISKLGTKK